MPRPTNTEERRAQIAEGLIKVMAKRGYDGASVAEIAKAAGLTQGLVHYHFKDKREILLVALGNLSAGHNARLAQRLSTFPDDPIAQLGAFIDFHLGLGADADPEALACWILLSGEALRELSVRLEFEKALEAMVTRVRKIIETGVAQKLFACDSVEAAASAIIAMVQGYFVLAAAARAVIPKGSAANAAKQMAAGLLRPARPFPDPRSKQSPGGGHREPKTRKK